MGARAAGKRETNGLFFLHVCLLDKTYSACKLPGEQQRGAHARVGNMHFTIIVKIRTAATQHANFSHANGLREREDRCAVMPRVSLALLWVHLLMYCLQREYIRFTVAAGVFHGRLPSIVMSSREFLSVSHTKRDINDIPCILLYIPWEFRVNNKNKREKGEKEGDITRHGNIFRWWI